MYVTSIYCTCLHNRTINTHHSFKFGETAFVGLHLKVKGDGLSLVKKRFSLLYLVGSASSVSIIVVWLVLACLYFFTMIA